MFDWIWRHIIGPALNLFFTSDWGIIVGLIVAALIIGWAWRTFGWQGLLSAAAAVVGFIIFRQGWKARDSLDAEGRSVPPPGPAQIIPPLKPMPATPKPKRKDKPSGKHPTGINPATGTWWKPGDDGY